MSRSAAAVGHIMMSRTNGLFFLRQVQGRRHFSSGTSAVVNHLHQEKLLQYNLLAGVEVEGSSTKTPCWVPDPRTGIYFLIGQEVVMEGIPETAARLGHDIWVRSIDTV